MSIKYFVPWLTLLSGFAFSQTADFDFRSDDRPGFEKTITVEELTPLLSGSAVLLLDVRLEEDFNNDPTLIPGATYVNPESLPNWIATINPNQEVVVYCVAGKWVSQKVAYLLHQAGLNVRSLEGGIAAWHAAGIR